MARRKASGLRLLTTIRIERRTLSSRASLSAGSAQTRGDRIRMNVLITRVWRNERDNLRAFKGFARHVAGTAKRQQQIWSYLYSGITPKLHLGAGDNILAGWLKTDSTPASSGTVF